MADSLRDQLLGLGFKPAPKPDKPAHDAQRPRNDRPRGERGASDRNASDRNASDRNAGDRNAGDRPRSERPRGDRPRGDGTHERGGHGRPANARGPHAGRPAQPGAQAHTGQRTHAGQGADAGAGKPAHARGPRPGGPQKSRGEMDLAKAYAIRAQKEKDERIAAEKARQEEAAKRREGKAKLAELLRTASLNVADADIARHFEYGGKIRRVYVTAEQLKAINAGELAIVQQGGRYCVVTPQHAKDAEALLPGALALLADPSVPSADDQYADPKYQVPDDLIW